MDVKQKKTLKKRESYSEFISKIFWFKTKMVKLVYTLGLGPSSIKKNEGSSPSFSII